MKFWDREKEKEWMKRYLQTEPNAILFVYGPKSSGKTTLLMKVIQELSRSRRFLKRHEIYWYDLRGLVVSNYKDVLRILFEDADSEAMMEFESEVMIGIPGMMGFRVRRKVLEEIEEGKVDAFRYMERKMVERGRRGVIVFDELQKLKEVYLNGDARQRPLVRELFNFFVRITKVLHLAHVIVMTSDTFFIKQVYTDSTLENTSRFFLVDFFDDETAKKILISEGLNERDAQHVVNWIGGVPWMLEEILEGDNPSSTVKELYDQVSSKMFETLRGRKDLREIIKRSLEGENLYYLEKEYEKVKELVDKEVLFMDPIRKVVRFQTKLHERAAREILGVK